MLYILKVPNLNISIILHCCFLFRTILLKILNSYFFISVYLKIQLYLRNKNKKKNNETKIIKILITKLFMSICRYFIKKIFF